MRSKRTANTEDRDAFRSAFGENFADVGGFIRRRCVSSDPEAIVAETFLVAWRRWDQRPAAASEVRPWLFGIARNVMAATDRHERKRGALEAAATQGPSMGHIVEAATSDPDIHAALMKLRPADRDVILLAAWEDLDTAGLAVALDTSAAAARVRLHRARRRLAHLLNAQTPSSEHQQQPTASTPLTGGTTV